MSNLTDHPRLSVITDWRTRDEDLADLDPGATVERSIVPQMFVVLHRIVTRGPRLESLRIGHVAVPFELEQTDGEVRHYRPTPDPHGISALAPAAVMAGPWALALAPGLEIWLRLRNAGPAPVKPRVALLVQEARP